MLRACQGQDLIKAQHCLLWEELSLPFVPDSSIFSCMTLDNLLTLSESDPSNT